MSRDPYASRQGRVAEIVPRLDPVVFGDCPGPLPPEVVADFERDGFAFLKDWLEPSLARELLEATESLARALGDAVQVVREPDSAAVRSVFAVHESLPLVRRLCEHPKVVGVARQILGDDVYVHQSRVNFKPALSGREFFWHSDFETWHVEDGMPRMRALSMSLNLTESHEHNGPLLLIPGSHRHYVRCVGETPENHYEKSLRRQEYGVPAAEALEQLTAERGIVAPKGGAGSAVFFDCNTMHGSVGNLSSRPRVNLFVVFNAIENRLVAPFGARSPRPAHVAVREPVLVSLGEAQP
jgi:ectoine hydroxylase